MKKPVKEELDQLFQQYPLLRAKLHAIYQETLDPGSRPDAAHRQHRPRIDTRWTEEKGFEKGLRILKAKLETDSATQADMQAFVAFVSSNSSAS